MNPRTSVVPNQMIEATNHVAPIRKYLLRFCISSSFVLLFIAMFVIGHRPNAAHAQLPLTPVVATVVGPGPIDPGGPVIDPSLLGATIKVNNSGDLSDTNVGDGFCDVNAAIFGEQCSLRAAIEEANSMSGRLTAHRIEFEFSGVGPFQIDVGTNIGAQLPTINVPVIIDGTSQEDSTCPTRLNPADLQVVISGDGTVGNGLVFGDDADGSTLHGVAIGGFSGISVRFFGSDNELTCSHIGVDAAGMASMGSLGVGVDIGTNSTGNVIGGDDEHANRNVIAGHGLQGIVIWGQDNLVQNNYIGTTADGMTALGNALGGIQLRGDSNDIGGTTRRSRNVISGNGSIDASAFGGVAILSANENVIAGNYIGLARDYSSALPNVGNGVEVIGGSNDNIVGPINGDNEIAFNTENGVFIDNRAALSERNTIRGNAIHSNDGLGIELAGASIGPDINDLNDPDVGPNNHQNYPVLLSAVISGTLDGRLRSMANTQYDIEIFENDVCDPSGHGEGQLLLDIDVVQTNNNGLATFSIPLSSPVGSFITATATDPDGNTSEFSECIEVTASAAATSAETEAQPGAAVDSTDSMEEALARTTPNTAKLPPKQIEDANETTLFLPLVSSR